MNKIYILKISYMLKYGLFTNLKQEKNKPGEKTPEPVREAFSEL